ncbi:Melanocortin-2 receptor accessory protein 2 [Varanus komodoensis]|nr:Melanocortin-2 receptor accessory protein 2 [Varanus komodoensis]
MLDSYEMLEETESKPEFNALKCMSVIFIVKVGSLHVVQINLLPSLADSIVIGFWVGLAVFVIFMFFVLTLLTKTGAPHQENADSSEKRLCMNNFVADFGGPLDSDRIFSSQAAEESRLLFHCYVDEFENMDREKQCLKMPVVDRKIHFQELIQNSRRLEEELNCHSKFNIPNFVNTDQNSSLGEDDLLIAQPPIILESKPASQAS